MRGGLVVTGVTKVPVTEMASLFSKLQLSLKLTLLFRAINIKGLSFDDIGEASKGICESHTLYLQNAGICRRMQLMFG